MNNILIVCGQLRQQQQQQQQQKIKVIGALGKILGNILLDCNFIHRSKSSHTNLVFHVVAVRVVSGQIEVELLNVPVLNFQPKTILFTVTSATGHILRI
jgi:hypothetical protein